jgi:lactoylglutathione lyase
MQQNAANRYSAEVLLLSISLNLVVIRSSDIDRAVQFYNQLGLRFHRQQHDDGPEHYSTQIGNTVFEIYPLNRDGASSIGVRLGFVVDSLSDVLNKMREVGVKVISQSEKREWGYSCVVEDFDGHKVEVSDATFEDTAIDHE